MLKTLLLPYWEVCMLRRSPADTPYSPLLLVIFSLSYYILVQFQWNLQKLPAQFTIQNPLSAGFFVLLGTILYVGGMLAAMRKANRFVQTTTSLMAVHSIIHLLLLPLVVIMAQLIVFPDQMTQMEMPSAATSFLLIALAVLSLVITIWQLVIMMFILRKAMDADQLSGVLATLGLLIFANVFASFMGMLL
ncbi:MAG: YIP1 family protein [Legionellaceae bacterium]|nr:YIP1 family protein [Legionellaceae bacterium]